MDELLAQDQVDPACQEHGRVGAREALLGFKERPLVAGRLRQAQQRGVDALRVFGYLDFRLPDLAWRGGREGSAAWYKGFAERPSMLETWPKG